MVNPSDEVVVVYWFPPLSASLASGALAGYSLTLTGNSTFSGAYIFADVSGSYPITGFAGINGTAYYHLFPSNSSNFAAIRYLVPVALSSPYLVGLTNSYKATQDVSVGVAVMATCGDSWMLQASLVK